jgi:LysM repeat protein
LNALKGFTRIIKSFFNLCQKIFYRPLRAIGFFFYKFVIINIYKLFYHLSQLVRAILPSNKLQPVYVFFNKYIIHIIIIILVASSSFANFFASTTKAEGFGEKSVLYALATGDNLEENYIEETLTPNQPKVTSYLESQTTAVTAPQDILTTEKPDQDQTSLTLTGDSGAIVKPELTTTNEAKIQRDKTIDYVVLDGDTISSIAEKFGITVNTILWENGLTSNSLIRPGQKLAILPTSGVSHKIAKGDTLDKIAQKYQADKQKILEFNKLADEKDLQVGSTLFVPEGKPYYAPVPQTKTALAPVKKIFEPVEIPVGLGDKMLWPTTTHRISQYFSWRHTGLDIDGDFGDPVWAAEAGTVTTSVCLVRSYGCHVIIDHGNGKSTLYGHFQKIYVKVGQKVAKGEVLGEEGSTGWSTGSHLHFEVRINGKKYNPLNYIR